MDANMACQQNKNAAPFIRLTPEEMDGIEAATNVYLPGCYSIIKLLRMSRECLRLREALQTVKVNLERSASGEVPEAICTYIDGQLAD